MTPSHAATRTYTGAGVGRLSRPQMLTDVEVKPQRIDSQLPSAIGRYRVVGRLGNGAMGIVYSAYDDAMDRPVAIKVMMAHVQDDPETSARFYREAHAAGQLVHRNIITIF